MLAIHPYLSFNGTCEIAFNFYKSIFGGEFQYVGRYKDMPMDQPLPDSEKEKIMHIALPLTDNVILMGADVSEIFGQTAKFGDNLALSLSPNDDVEAKRIFSALAEGGQITVSLEKTFWADLFGMVTDKFGVNWMLNYSEEECL